MAPKPSAGLVARFASIMDRFPDAERRPMFGFPAAFVRGNLATGLYGEGWMVRLGAAGAGEAIDAGRAATFEPMSGRPMTGYVLVPSADIWDDDAILGWVGRGLAFTRTLPAKA